MTGSHTFASLNEALQPIAQLKTNFFHYSATGAAACLECAPGCASCSGFFACSSCSAGSLHGGICLAESVTPFSGVAL